MKLAATLFTLALTSSINLISGPAQYRLPAQDVIDLIDAPRLATPFLSPNGTYLLITQLDDLRSIEYLAKPMIKVAGMRIFPRNNSQVKTRFYRQPVIKGLEDGRSQNLHFPQGSMLGLPIWAHDGRWVAFPNYTDEGVELWVSESITGKARDLTGPRVNATMMPGYRQVEHALNASFTPDGRHLLVYLVPQGRGRAPQAPQIPAGPIVMSTSGRFSREKRWEDMLQNPHDEDLFDYYCTSRLWEFDVKTGQGRRIGPAGKFITAPSVSPDGRFLLIQRVKRPYSYWVRYREFSTSIELWDRNGKLLKVLFNLPPVDEATSLRPSNRPRALQWQPHKPATLVWVQPADRSDPATREYRDVIWSLGAPFSSSPRLIHRLRYRLHRMEWLAAEDEALVTQLRRDKAWLTTSVVDFSAPERTTRIFDHGMQDRYHHPGTPLPTTTSRGFPIVLQDGDSIYLSGPGGSVDGDRPFLDRLNLRTLQKERLFQSGEDGLETFFSFAGSSRDLILTRYETPSQPPNYFLHNLQTGERRALTNFSHPYPQFSGISKQLVKYQRGDGVDLSGTLYLPADHKVEQRLPLVIWAYPWEYQNREIASQVRIAPQAFTNLRGPSPPYSKIFAVAGFALLDGAEMPVIGPPRALHDTYVKQIVAAATAAIKKLDSLGIIDPARVGMIGHSYGGFSTANLLANSDLFAAGIARSGSHNRTMTPWGFRLERRSLWEAPEIYFKVSPFLNADKINEPVLFIHGLQDDSQASKPIHSHYMFQALRGTGATAKLVFLPLENHRYAARETILHAAAEMIEWFEIHLKKGLR